MQFYEIYLPPYIVITQEVWNHAWKRFPYVINVNHDLRTSVDLDNVSTVLFEKTKCRYVHVKTLGDKVPLLLIFRANIILVALKAIVNS